jgi:hypothetical protein
MTKNLPANADGGVIARMETEARDPTRHPVRTAAPAERHGRLRHHERAMGFPGHTGDRLIAYHMLRP